MSKSFGWIVLLSTLLSALAIGCDGTALTPLTPVRGLTRTGDVSYGTYPRRKLDVYQPHNVAAPAPVIIFFYGGWWSTGNKEEYEFAAQAFTSRGFVVVIPNYRLIPSVKFPAFVEDGAAAIKWTHDHIADYGGDPNRMYLAGHSAGGHIALLLAYDEHYLHDVGLDRSVIKAVAPMSAPTDFKPVDTERFAFGMKYDQTEPDQSIEPIHFVSRDVPPTLIIQGLEDRTVNPDQASKLFARLSAAGAGAEYIGYPSLDHIGVVLSLWYPLRWRSSIADEIARFFMEH
jgi:acetyl esterase/lipase